MIETLGPELTVFVGLLLIMIVPNLGNGTFRIPGTSIRLPWLFGGTRFKAVASPRLPGLLAVLTMALALFQVVWYLLDATSADGQDIIAGGILIFKVNMFSRIFEAIFFAALLLAAIASLDRLPTGPQKSDDIDVLFNNRRQADFYILMLTSALGMSVVALAQDMFVLFVGLELASFSTYVLVAFHKESRAGSEGGAKYFIVGSVASAVGLYGLSMLYLWAGSLQFDVLATTWAEKGATSLSMMALGFVLVGFAFKISAAPFHFAAPDAYSGANSPVAGVLATASKAMGMLGLMRVLLIITVPEANADGSAVWIGLFGVLAAVTMTWGNIAALGSENPKRMLAYSSVAHAGYMLAALTAIGAWNWGLVDNAGDAMDVALQNYMREEYNLLIGDSTAEKIKKEVGTAIPTNNNKYPVKGRDIRSGTPKEINVTEEDTAAALNPILKEMIGGIKMALENTPPELSADLVDMGLTLTGGGALLKNIDRRFSKETGLPVHIAEDPLACVAIGTGKALDQEETFSSMLTEY